MFPLTLSDSRAATIPVPSVNFNGEWRSELGSSIDLKVAADGTVRGTYKRAVAAAPTQEDFPLVGFAAGALLCITANLGKYGSVISWVGQHSEDSKNPVIKTMWLLARYVPDPDDPTDLGGATVTGYTHFVR